MCFALGEAYAIAADNSVLIIGLLIMAAPVLSVADGKTVAATIFLLIAVVGFMNVQTVSRQKKFAELFEEKKSAQVSGRIYDIRQGDRNQVYMYCTDITAGSERYGEAYEYRGRMRMLLYIDDIGKLRMGQEITISTGIARPDIATNPGAFDARSYYASKGIYLTGRDVQILRYGDGYSVVRQFLYWFRNTAGEVIDTTWKAQNATVVRAMLLGEKSSLDRDTKRLFQLNGIAHILAISGVHIAIIGMTLLKLLRRLSGSYLVPGIISIVVVILYGMMTGLASSTFRAVVMMAITVIGRVKGRTPDMLTSAGTALIIQAMVVPGIIMDAGFQLSFAAVAGMAVPDCFMDGILTSDNRLLNTIKVNISVTLATAPVVVYYFYQIPLYSVALNLIIVPLVSVILFCGILVIAVGMSVGVFGSSLWICEYIGMPVTWILGFYRFICKMMTHVPGYNVNVGHISVAMVVVYYAVILACLGLVSAAVRHGWSGKRRYKCIGFVLLCLCLGICSERLMYDSAYRIIFMDVGQGDGILIRSGDGTNILIDGGSSDKKGVGEYVMTPVLRYYGAAHVDYAFLTHGDNDHTSGIRYLLETPDTGIVIDNLVVAGDGDVQGLQDIIDLAEQKGTHVIYMEAGYTMTCGKNAAKMRLSLLHPGSKTGIKDANDLSAVIRLEYAGVSVLFTGDLGEAGERELLDGGAKLSADILKVGHHGSRYSSSEEFLQSVGADEAVISAGVNNRYGHPHKETLERLERYGTDVLLTSRDGAVCVQIDEGSTLIQGYVDENRKENKTGN